MLSIFQGANPFLKAGDYIYLHSKKGRFKVVSVNESGFEVVGEKEKDVSKFTRHAWKDFKCWSSKS
ncbi:MAG TPA: hypothetical protein VGB84_00365 [Arachidicoccus sp.]